MEVLNMKKTFSAARKATNKACPSHKVSQIRISGGDVVAFAMKNKKAVNFLNRKERQQYQNRYNSIS